MNMEMIQELTIEEIASFYVLHLCRGQHLVDYACSALENGTGSSSFVLLAGESKPAMSVAGPLFEKGLAESGVVKPNKLQAQLNIARYYAKAIKDGHLTPYQGAHKIWWEVSNEIDHPSALLLSIIGAASEIEDLPERCRAGGYDPSPYIEEYKKAIIRLADQVLDIVDPYDLLKK